MTGWNQIALNVQNVAHKTDKALLLQMPHKSKYDGYNCWVARKLVRAGSHSYELHLSLNSEFSYRLFKQNSKYKVVSEHEVSADVMAEAFGGYLNK